MSLYTRLNLNEYRFEQISLDQLNLSGTTSVYGNLKLEVDGNAYICNGICYIFDPNNYIINDINKTIGASRFTFTPTVTGNSQINSEFGFNLFNENWFFNKYPLVGDGTDIGIYETVATQEWVNNDAEIAYRTTIGLDGLDDVNLSGLTIGNLIEYDGTNFINVAKSNINLSSFNDDLTYYCQDIDINKTAITQYSYTYSELGLTEPTVTTPNLQCVTDVGNNTTNTIQISGIDNLKNDADYLEIYNNAGKGVISRFNRFSGGFGTMALYGCPIQFEIGNVIVTDGNFNTSIGTVSEQGNRVWSSNNKFIAGDNLSWSGETLNASSNNNYVTSVSGSGNGILTLTREGLTDLTTDLSHDHGDGQYTDRYLTGFTGNGNTILTATLNNNTNVSIDLSHDHNHFTLTGSSNPHVLGLDDLTCHCTINSIRIDREETDNLSGVYGALTCVQNTGQTGQVTDYIYANITYAKNYGANDVTWLVGSRPYVYHEGIGTVNSAIGVVSQAQNNSTGIITNAHGNFGTVENNNSGTIDNAYGFSTLIDGGISGITNNAYGVYINNFNTSNITNLYGLYINNNVNGATGLNYSIYSETTAPAYFAGNINIDGTIDSVDISTFKTSFDNHIGGNQHIDWTVSQVSNIHPDNYDSSNYYVTDVTGTGNSTLTITVSGASNVSTDLSHTHSEYITSETDTIESVTTRNNDLNGNTIMWTNGNDITNQMLIGQYGTDTDKFRIVPYSGGSAQFGNDLEYDFTTKIWNFDGTLKINQSQIVTESWSTLQNITNQGNSTSNRIYITGDGNYVSTASGLKLYYQSGSGIIKAQDGAVYKELSLYGSTINLRNGDVNITDGDLVFDIDENRNIKYPRAIFIREAAWSAGDYFDIRGSQAAGSQQLNIRWHDQSAGTDTEYFRIDPSGNVGIQEGLLNVNNVLQVDGTGDSYFMGQVGIKQSNPQYGNLEINATTGNTNGGITLYDGGNYITSRQWIDSNGVWQFTRGGTAGNGLTIDESGNVGIQKSLMSSTLDVNGTINASGNVTGANLNISNWDSAYSHSTTITGNPHQLDLGDLCTYNTTNTITAPNYIATTENTLTGGMSTIAYRFSEGRGWGYNSADDRVFYNAANGVIPFWVDLNNAQFNANLNTSAGHTVSEQSSRVWSDNYQFTAGSNLTWNTTTIPYTLNAANHTRYTDSEARSALQTGDVTQITGTNNRIKFDTSVSWIEIVDKANNRQSLVTDDVYINQQTTWVSDHMTNASAHHTKTTSISDLTDHTKANHDSLNIDADTVDGFNTSTTAPNTITIRNSSCDICARLFKSTYGTTNTTINYIMTKIDHTTNSYIRPTTPAQFRAGVTDAYYADASHSHNYIPNTVGTWHSSTDGQERFYFTTNGHTYLRTGDDFYFRNDGNSTIATLDQSGNFTAAGTATADAFRTTGTGLRFCGGTGCGCAVDWIASSDIRFKTNIEPITGALSKVDALCGVCYELCENNELGIGLIAQDVEKVEPRLVSKNEPDESHREKYGINDETYGLKYDKFAGLFVEAIKELKRDNINLQNQINKLNEKINYITNNNK